MLHIQWMYPDISKHKDVYINPCLGQYKWKDHGPLMPRDVSQETSATSSMWFLVTIVNYCHTYIDANSLIYEIQLPTDAWSLSVTFHHVIRTGQMTSWLCILSETMSIVFTLLLHFEVWPGTRVLHFKSDWVISLIDYHHSGAILRCQNALLRQPLLTIF